jgi:hypothetical protein
MMDGFEIVAIDESSGKKPGSHADKCPGKQTAMGD